MAKIHPPQSNRMAMKYFSKLFALNYKIDIPNLYLYLLKQDCEVISVDLFDTIVFRRCANPHSVFKIQHEILLGKLNLGMGAVEWSKLRADIELAVRLRSGSREIELCQIYDEIGKLLNWPSWYPGLAQDAELEAERSVIRPHWHMVLALKDLQISGKSIVVTTDMYLPESFIRSILDSILDFPYDLRVSSTTGMPKRTGLAFPSLIESYKGQKILHIGDNPNSDVRQPRKFGMSAGLIEWRRSEGLRRNVAYTNHLESMNIFSFDTPFDAPILLGSAEAREEIAWRWAIILLDFVLEIRQYAQEIAADEIWFLSRDCETLYKALEPYGEVLFSKVTSKYVYTSRRATYPIVAKKKPEKYIEWTGKPPSETTLQQGEELTAAYAQMCQHSTKKVVIVDTGWKGRIQFALQEALPNVKVYGYYFSLDPKAEKTTIDASRCFLDWDPTVITQAAAEALAGFLGDSCSGYSLEAGGRWIPTFTSAQGDISPPDYVTFLHKYLSSLILLIDRHNKPAPKASRIQVVKQLLAYPDKVAAEALREWGFSEGSEGKNTQGFLAEGGNATFIDIMLGRYRRGNLWPQIAVWKISPFSWVTVGLQYAMNTRRKMLGK